MATGSVSGGSLGELSAGLRAKTADSPVRLLRLPVVVATGGDLLPGGTVHCTHLPWGGVASGLD